MNIIFNKLLEQFPNIIESPFLIWEMLTMLRVGIKGESAQELDNFLEIIETEIGINKKEFEDLGRKYMLQVNTDLPNISLTTEDVLTPLSSPKEKPLWIANRIFIKQGTSLNQNFTNALRDKYACEAKELDFERPQKAAESINSWVKSATNERIPSIISGHDVGPSTQAVLANAIYFKAQWKQQFEPDETSLKPFHIDAQQSLPVTMMSQTMKARYAHLPNNGAQLLELPYRDCDLAMLVILPQSEMASDLRSLAHLRLKDVVQYLAYRTVHINLPKFTFGCTINVHNILEELGVRGIFHSSQDFSDLVGEGASDFSVSKIIQQAFIKVTEEGTEAAAATACCIDGSMSFEEKFIADRPFYFCIKNRNCVKLFDGCYRKPSESS